MLNSQVKAKLYTWVLVDPMGNLDPSNMIQLPYNQRPKGRRWHRIPTSFCCNTQSFITFRNTTAAANITAIKTGDNAINWTGLIANNGYLTFEIPMGYDENFTITVDTPTGRTITNTVVKQNTANTATISSPGAITMQMNTFATNPSAGAQFVSILS